MKESRGITPLRTILQNCLNHIENLETNRSICDNYDKEFQDLKQFSETLKTQSEFSCTEGEKEVNRKKNRYKDILPFNVSRVILSEYAGVPGSDYINANYIKGASGSPAYIASQGPLPNTVNDFWRMVVECDVQVIVMACNAQESGKHKCENYWVEKEGEEKRFGMVKICLVKASTVCPDFLVRTMRLQYMNDKDVTERTVCQFHYSAWPDHGVPPLVRPLLDMVRLVRDTQASETLPVLVHCSAGCGRTGTICAIDFVWGLLRAGKLTEDFSLFNLVRDMRKQRVAMVQTKEQYILVHQAVRELFKEQLRVIESHPYENIDFNGVPLIKDFEEPFYDTISVQKEENCDEKQDKSEEKEKVEDVDSRLGKIDAAPPLPRKKRPNVLFSKQEKEAENLTEKNRSSYAEKEREKERTDASLSSLLGKPRIVKLRALFEKSPTTKERAALKDRGSQTVSRSHSLGAIRKPVTSEVFEIEKSKPLSAPPQPTSDSSGKLKHSKSFSKSVPLIKRSKSLKTFSQSSHLCVSPANTVDRKVFKNYQAKPPEVENHSLNGSESFKKKLSTTCDTVQTPGPSTDSSKRRRSLESLMGDIPPTITWPAVVMSIEKESGSLMKSRQKLTNCSPKMSSNTLQVSKTADMLKHQLQRLSLETEKKMNSIVSGIGVRERRNSFRQAVSKSDFQNVFRDYYEQHSSSPKKQLGNENALAHWKGSHSKVIQNSNEVSQLTNQSDMIPSKSFFDGKKNKDKPITGDTTHVIKINSRHPQPNSLAPGSNQIILDLRKRKGMSGKTCGMEERSSDSKNLFLKRLNSEILNERERDTEERSRSSYEESDKSSVSRLASSSTLVHSDSKKTLYKSNVKPTGSYCVNSDSFDEPDGHGARQNPSFQGHQTYVKPVKTSASFDSYKCYTTAPVTNPNFYNRANPSSKGLVYTNSGGEGSVGLRRDEMPQEVRHKEPFFAVSHKKSICLMPSKAHSSHENEVTFGSYRRNPGVSNPELYVTINPEIESNEKKLMLPPKITSADKAVKTYDCLPWSRSSAEKSSSDQISTKSETSRLLGHYESESPLKPEVKLIKIIDQGKGSSKPRMNETIKITQDSEASGSGMQKRAEDLKSNSSVEFCNYGVVGSTKLRQNPPKYSKDDFLLEEPTAPPRVKRHASVAGPRNQINGSDRVSIWVSAENKLSNDRSTTLQAGKNTWGGSFGVDLDAVAASMQQEKREPSVLKDGVWSGKNNLSMPANTSGKKKQHYF